jgi:hypothetical protein
MSSGFRLNPNFERDLRREVEKNLRREAGDKMRALAQRLRGRDPQAIRAALKAEGFTNVKDELVEALRAGHEVPAKITWT